MEFHLNWFVASGSPAALEFSRERWAKVWVFNGTFYDRTELQDSNSFLKLNTEEVKEPRLSPGTDPHDIKTS